jgi:predicted ester cyclase
LVTIYWIARGTNTGAGNGLPATGKKAELAGITIWRIVDGKIKEEWSAFDQLSLMQQLGLASGQPTPGATETDATNTKRE